VRQLVGIVVVSRGLDGLDGVGQSCTDDKTRGRVYRSGSGKENKAINYSILNLNNTLQA
jgi:hypothetical protein